MDHGAEIVVAAKPGRPSSETTPIAWACDFIQSYDLLFGQVYAFFIVSKPIAFRTVLGGLHVDYRRAA